MFFLLPKVCDNKNIIRRFEIYIKNGYNIALHVRVTGRTPTCNGKSVQALFIFLFLHINFPIEVKKSLFYVIIV